jgi:autotransporter-associated beta strand protein
MQGGGTLVLDPTGGSNTYSGGTIIERGTVDLATARAAGSGAIVFQNQVMIDPTLEFTAANAPTNAIEGFGTGDFIQIDNFLATSPAPTYSGGFLTLHGTDQTGKTPEVVTLDVPGQALSDFQVHVGATDTVIEYAACYCRGTLIATDKGEVAVETLAIGDGVVTASGAARPIKWIGRRSYGGRFIMGRKDMLPVCVKAGALADNLPRRDLWISPHHAMYLDGVLIEAKDLVNGVSIVQAAGAEKVEYFHIELDSHDVIIAEGALSESFVDDDSRGMFHNANEYRALYPDAPYVPARYCAPRLDEGYAVAAARRRIDARAGLRPAAQDQPQALRGHVDVVSPRRIAGWAQNVAHPEAPVRLDIFAGGQLIGQVLANRHRDDLARAGLGSGRHSFDFTPPAGLAFAQGSLEVRRSFDGVALGKSEDSARMPALSA